MSKARCDPGWKDWAARFNAPTTPVPGLRFDVFHSALGAAKAGLGVFLASLPLCQTEISNGTLIRLSDAAIDHHETYWLLASRDAVSQSQWEMIEKII